MDLSQGSRIAALFGGGAVSIMVPPPATRAVSAL